MVPEDSGGPPEERAGKGLRKKGPEGFYSDPLESSLLLIQASNVFIECEMLDVLTLSTVRPEGDWKLGAPAN